MNSYLSMDYWFAAVVQGDNDPKLVENMYECLGSELPTIVSVIAERTCNLQCTHCGFQKERSSERDSCPGILEQAVKTVVEQIGPNPKIVHEGRIFRPWHLDWLQAVRQTREDSRIGMIDNGSFLDQGEKIIASGFKFDWIDISLDGPEAVHNRQRNSSVAFWCALRGLENAPRFLQSGYGVSSLFTLTKLNYDAIADTAKVIPTSVVWHISTMSAIRPEIEHLAVNDHEFAISWQQIVNVGNQRPVVVRIYSIEDLLKLAKAAGGKKMLEAMAAAEVDLAAISFVIDGIRVIYYPRSVCTSETVVIDADGCYRLPYSIAYTLEEYRRGKSRYGEDIGYYTVGTLKASSNLRLMYEECVTRWKVNQGLVALEKERRVFEQIRNMNERR